MPNKQRKWEIVGDYQWQYCVSTGMIEYRIHHNSQKKTLTYQKIYNGYDGIHYAPEEIDSLTIPCAEMPTVEQAIDAVVKAMANELRSIL